MLPGTILRSGFFIWVVIKVARVSQVLDEILDFPKTSGALNLTLASHLSHRLVSFFGRQGGVFHCNSSGENPQ
jgi:hypothetical protein